LCDLFNFGRDRFPHCCQIPAANKKVGLRPLARTDSSSYSVPCLGGKMEARITEGGTEVRMHSSELAGGTTNSRSPVSRQLTGPAPVAAR
jgi:hypothetical protein